MKPGYRALAIAAGSVVGVWAFLMGVILMLPIIGKIFDKFSSSDQKAQEEQRKNSCPDLSTWAACAERLAMKAADEKRRAEESQRTQLEAVRAKISVLWATYDSRPKRDKPMFLEVFKGAIAQAETLPEPHKTSMRNEIFVSGRDRMAPLVRPEARAVGENREILIPSSNQMQCLLWASMWSNSDETLSSLQLLGYQRVDCKSKTWDVDELARTCFLYWDSSSGNKVDDSIEVWKTVEYFQLAQKIGRERGVEASVQLLGLMSKGASIMRPGSHFVIVENVNGLVRIEGRGELSGIAGYVEATAPEGPEVGELPYTGCQGQTEL